MDHVTRYMIITPAFNEAKYLGKTIESVIRQTLPPARWVIVDDGSTDQTAQIILRYARSCPWISYLHREKDPTQTYYASNVYALLAGYEAIRNSSFEYLAILDADIILCHSYYEELFKRFEMNQDMGIAAGGLLESVGGKLENLEFDRYSTPKAFQVFRRECYERIGGYFPCRNGGEDTCAEILARMHGWKTWSFPDVKAIHQRPVGTGDGSKVLRARFRQGLADYCLSTHPVFMLAKCLSRCVKERPRVLSGLARLCGFLSGYLRAEQRELSGDARRYVRREQITRLLARARIGRPLWKPVSPAESDKRNHMSSTCDCLIESGRECVGEISNEKVRTDL